MHQREDDIYASAPMRRLLDDQTQVLKPALQRCFGSHALLLGAAPGDAPPALPMLGCWTSLHLHQGRYVGDVRAAVDEPLPFIDEAFDLVMVRHALEVAPLPAVLLNEAIRVLAPGAILVLTGVHPVGGWSPWLHWYARKKAPSLQMPWRLRRQLDQAGVQIELAQRIGSIWPGLTGTSRVMAEICGGGYVLVARKRRSQATPLRFRPVPVPVPAAGELSPGARRSSVA